MAVSTFLASGALLLAGICSAQYPPGDDLAPIAGPGDPVSGTWTFEEGTIVGAAEAGTRAMLAVPVMLWNFELRFEVAGAENGSAAVMFRTHWLPETPIPPDADPKTLPRRMTGYTVPLDFAAPVSFGAIVEEGERGTLVNASDDAQEGLIPGDWNAIAIRAEGAVVTVTVNGVTSAVLEDEASIAGHIVFALSAAEGAGASVRFRNPQLQNLGRLGDWRALFDGQTLSGWKEWGSESWTVADGAIQGRRGPRESEGYLATAEQWTDFRVRGRFKMLGDGNYGLFYHSTIRLRDDGYPLISGVQGEVEPSYPGATGWHYESYRRGWIIEPDKTSPAAFATRPGEWNEIEIRATGNYITSWVNGYRVLDFHDASPQVFSGGFALQLHTGEGAGIDWKDLYVLD